MVPFYLKQFSASVTFFCKQSEHCAFVHNIVFIMHYMTSTTIWHITSTTM